MQTKVSQFVTKQEYITMHTWLGLLPNDFEPMETCIYNSLQLLLEGSLYYQPLTICEAIT